MYQGGLHLLETVQNRILEKGCLLSLYSFAVNGWNPERELRFLRNVGEQRHLGLLAFCNPDGVPRNLEELQRMSEGGTRVMHIEPYGFDTPTLEYLMPDYWRAGYAMAVHLLLAGYERILFAGLPNSMPMNALMFRGFLDALREHGASDGVPRELMGGDMPEKANLITLYGFSPNVGIEQNVDSFLRKLGKGVGIACGSMMRTAKLRNVLGNGNVAIPEEVGIVGCELTDDWLQTDYPMPIHADRIVFDRASMFLRAVDAIVGTSRESIREWVSGHLIREGTVRPGVDK
jgi:DNA-binding LacI/PurR family transcriptional regulator